MKSLGFYVDLLSHTHIDSVTQSEFAAGFCGDCHGFHYRSLQPVKSGEPVGQSPLVCVADEESVTTFKGRLLDGWLRLREAVY